MTFVEAAAVTIPTPGKAGEIGAEEMGVEGGVLCREALVESERAAGAGGVSIPTKRRSVGPIPK